MPRTAKRKRVVSGRLVRFAVTLVAATPMGIVGQDGQSGCSDAVQGDLGGYVGRWQVESVFRASASAWATTRATVTITSELTGCLLREDYQGDRFGKPYAYLALWGANGLDPVRYQRVFAHSQHGLLTLRQGWFVGDTLVLRSTTRVRGIDVLEEDRISRPTVSGFTLSNRRSTDGGRSWITTRRSRYVRKPEGGA